VLLNLVGNAIEHNHAGGSVSIDASIDGNDLRLAVSDTGPGIAAQHLPHLFEPFYRVDKSRAVGEGHLGLGLFLVKTHVDAMGGQCNVRSELGVGTTFELLLPGVVVICSADASAREILSRNVQQPHQVQVVEAREDVG
jgi:signal transduction histidine kinase